MIDKNSREAKKLYIQTAIYIFVFALAMLCLFVKLPSKHTDKTDFTVSIIYEYYYWFMPPYFSLEPLYQYNYSGYEEIRLNTSDNTYVQRWNSVSISSVGTCKFSGDKLILKENTVEGMETERVFKIQSGGEMLVGESEDYILWGSHSPLRDVAAYDGDGDGTYEAYCLYRIDSTRHTLTVYDAGAEKIYSEELNIPENELYKTYKFESEEDGLYLRSYNRGITTGQNLYRIVRENGKITVESLIYD